MTQAMRSLGASSIIVINNNPGETNFVMAADHASLDEDDIVNEISAIIISKEDGDKLKKALKNTERGEKVTVEYKVWM